MVGHGHFRSTRIMPGVAAPEDDIMEKVYITGHRNPDLDSICAAYSYAVLKNRVDPDNKYIGVRCGHVSSSIKSQLEAVGLTEIEEDVPYMKDVYPKVRDVMNSDNYFIDSEEPVYYLLKKFGFENPSARPVFRNGEYIGLLNVDDIMVWFLKDNSDKVPAYDISVENIEKILPGKLVKRGSNIHGAVMLAGAGDVSHFSAIVESNPNSVIALGYRPEHVRVAVESQVPCIIITMQDSIPDVDLTGYKGTFYVTTLGTSETLRRMRLAVCVRDLMGVQDSAIPSDTLFDAAKDMIIKDKKRGLSVMEDGRWIGFVTGRCFLNKPSYNVILVDHNEMDQSIRGIETATVREILDHHRLDALKTELPIFIDAEPVGSTCTIVYRQFIRCSVIPDRKTAKVLLTGILSDTLILRSPTTTDVDRSSAGALAALCGIFDINGYGEKLFSCSESLVNVDEDAAINSDFKNYTERGFKIGIGQCETSTLAGYESYSERFISALNRIKTVNHIDWTMLMVTDVLTESSILLVSESRFNKKLPFKKLADGVYDMPKIVSRKKQLLSEVLSCLD